MEYGVFCSQTEWNQICLGKETLFWNLDPTKFIDSVDSTDCGPLQFTSVFAIGSQIESFSVDFDIMTSQTSM